MLAINFTDVADGGAVLDALAANIARAWTIGDANGAGPGAPAATWSASYTVDPDGHLSVALAAAATPLAVIKGLILYAYPANASVLAVAGDGVDAIVGNGAVALQPGELLVKVTPTTAGYPLTDASALVVHNPGGAPAQFGILVIGA